LPHLTIEWQAEGTGEQTATIDDSRGALIGRALENDIVIPCPYASRHHAVIYYVDDAFQLLNLSETNPTIYNDRRELAPEESTALRPGDTFTIGRIRLRIPPAPLQPDQERTMLLQSLPLVSRLGASKRRR
jgi:predicted component of type VI protein secretion system